MKRIFTFRVVVCFLAMALLSACGSERAQELEGDWLLVAGHVQQERRPVEESKAFVISFRNGEFSMPVHGGLRKKSLRLQRISYRREGDQIVLGDESNGSLKLEIVALDGETLRLKGFASKGDGVDLEFRRIDEGRVSALRAADHD